MLEVRKWFATTMVNVGIMGVMGVMGVMGMTSTTGCAKDDGESGRSEPAASPTPRAAEPSTPKASSARDAEATDEPTPTNGASRRYGIAIHGGAGTIDPSKLTGDQEQRYRNELRAALDAGYAVLDEGGTSLDAVQAAIVILEDSPLFNAGKGAVFTHDGANEMDASMMNGETGEAGAVAGIRTVKNPIMAARAVMEKSAHVMLAGTGAEAFCKEQGLTLAPPEYFRTEHRYQQLERIRSSERVELDHGSDETPSEGDSAEASERPTEDKFGTVGAVAVDKQGHLAAGTSTGGMTNKRWGRIGDSPIIGAGTYADDDTCAVSATGHGEFFIREAAAHSVAARMRFAKQSLQEAAKAVVFEQLDPIGGTGGVITIDADGNVAMPFNTPGMYRGYRLSDGSSAVSIWTDDHEREKQASP